MKITHAFVRYIFCSLHRANLCIARSQYFTTGCCYVSFNSRKEIFQPISQLMFLPQLFTYCTAVQSNLGWTGWFSPPSECTLQLRMYVSVCGPDFDIAKKAILKIYSLYISIVYSSILMLQKHLGLFVEIDIFINGLGKLLL